MKTDKISRVIFYQLLSCVLIIGLIVTLRNRTQTDSKNPQTETVSDGKWRKILPTEIEGNPVKMFRDEWEYGRADSFPWLNSACGW
jgi:hypothetical protein